jgi:hypothetical protein
MAPLEPPRIEVRIEEADERVKISSDSCVIGILDLRGLDQRHALTLLAGLS